MAFAVSCRDPGIYRSAGITNGSRKCKSQTQETTKILPSQTSGEINCFSYESFSGKSWTYNDDEAYIDLGSSNEKAEECFYRVTFKEMPSKFLQTRVTTTEK